MSRDQNGRQDDIINILHDICYREKTKQTAAVMLDSQRGYWSDRNLGHILP